MCGGYTGEHEVRGPIWKFTTTESLLKSIQVCKRCLLPTQYNVDHLSKSIIFESVSAEETYSKSLQGSQRGCGNY